MIKAIIFDADGMIVHGDRFSGRLAGEFNIPLDTTKLFFKDAFPDCLIGKADLKEELEKYMKQWNYPGYVYHKGEHDAFVKKVAEFKAKFEQGQAAISVDILVFLKDWVSKHIQGTDKKYGPFFNKHGLK